MDGCLLNSYDTAGVLSLGPSLKKVKAVEYHTCRMVFGLKCKDKVLNPPFFSLLYVLLYMGPQYHAVWCGDWFIKFLY